jgi:hypothetical protein
LKRKEKREKRKEKREKRKEKREKRKEKREKRKEKETREIVYIYLTYIQRENKGEISMINHEIAKN